VGRPSERQALAPAYELALDLEAEGLDHVSIAEHLGLPVQAVPTLLAIARTKAAGHRQRPPTDPET
jgi:hypothetical protein